LLVVGCWLLVDGCWLLVVGCWLLVVGCWLRAKKANSLQSPSYAVGAMRVGFVCPVVVVGGGDVVGPKIDGSRLAWLTPFSNEQPSTTN
jgi:hypothetical protein